MGNVVIRMILSHLAQRYGHNKTNRSLILMGGAYLALGICLYFFLYEIILDLILDWQMQFKQGGSIFNIWKDSPLILRVWAFQVENGPKFQKGLEYPRVSEIGPFHFNGYRHRQPLEWSDNNGVLKVKESYSFEFDEKNSIGPLSMKVKTINLPILLFIQYLQMSSSSISSNITSMLEDNELITESSIGELLNIDQLSYSSFLDMLDSFNVNVSSDGDHSDQFKYSFHTFFDMNQTFTYEIYTGHTSTSPFNHYRSFANETGLKYFHHFSCNQLKGTESTFFGTKHDKEPIKYIFNPHLTCRPLKFNYVAESKFGFIYTQRYHMDDYGFSVIYKPENWCYCPEDAIEDECEGVFHSRQCLSGSPFLLSNVHFLKTPNRLRKVRGMHPNIEQHLSYIELEPTFGATVDSKMRVQINLNMLKAFSKDFDSFQQYRPIVMPYFWIEESYNVEGVFKMILTLCSLFFSISSFLFGLMGSFGACLLLTGIIRGLKMFIKEKCVVGCGNKTKQDHQQDDNNDEFIQKQITT